MKISASIYTADNPNKYAIELSKTNIDYMHLDFIENKNNYIEEIKKFNKFHIPLDVHLVFENITNDIVKQLNNYSVKVLSIQYENLKDVDQAVTNLKEFHNDFGFSIIPNTDCSKLLPYQSIMKHILIMCCNTPGMARGNFIEESYNFIEEVKSKFPQIPIYVDGGMNKERLQLMKEKGISVGVIGSYLYSNKNNLQGIIDELKK